jgi:two-component system, response regulator
MADKLPEIVLVEDNPDDEKLVERALKKANVPHRLTVLRDGEEAAAWLDRCQKAFETREDLPSIILMDHRVPKISGLDLLKRIRGDARFSTMPIVMMSSGAEHRDLSEYFLAGANSVISKGVDWAEAMEKLPATVNYWVNINRAGT